MAGSSGGVGVGIPPWRTVLAGILQRGRGSPETRYLQLANVDSEGRARNRTVVFRGFGPNSEILILSDTRSGKYAQLTRDPRAELCWYFPVTREQFRLDVLIHCYAESAPAPWAALRQRLWEERGARGQAEWVGAVADVSLPNPVPAFLLLVATVRAADHLELRPKPQLRTLHQFGAQGWSRQEIAP